MKTLYDVQQLLTRFGTIIYTGSQQADLDLMEEELRELARSGLIEYRQLTEALLLIRHRREQRTEKG